jgi:hypothetical protein
MARLTVNVLIFSSVLNHVNIFICLGLIEIFVIEQGNGTWEGRLRIMHVSADDVAREYVLKARNDVGLQEYRVSISTSTEPQGMRHIS